jgi:hypothetical protein
VPQPIDLGFLFRFINFRLNHHSLQVLFCFFAKDFLPECIEVFVMIQRSSKVSL